MAYGHRHGCPRRRRCRMSRDQPLLSPGIVLLGKADLLARAILPATVAQRNRPAASATAAVQRHAVDGASPASHGTARAGAGCCRRRVADARSYGIPGVDL